MNAPIAAAGKDAGVAKLGLLSAPVGKGRIRLATIGRPGPSQINAPIYMG